MWIKGKLWCKHLWRLAAIDYNEKGMRARQYCHRCEGWQIQKWFKPEGSHD
jgi:hypothetical protein